MNEFELASALVLCINLTIAAAGWWVTATTALVAATHFAGRQLPGWLFAAMLALYLPNALMALAQMASFNHNAAYFGARLAEWRVAHDIALPSPVEWERTRGKLAGNANWLSLAFGTLVAVVYSFVAWRAARKS